MASRLTQSISFHQSPEAFISSRLQQFALHSAEQESNGRANPIIRAEILDRNVHLISSYRLCKAILCASENVEDQHEGVPALVSVANDEALTTGVASPIAPETFAVRPAYEQLMVAFFPLPNMLLEDGEQHRQHKRLWQKPFDEVIGATQPLIRDVTLKAFVAPSKNFPADIALDLYETLKALSWEILFAIFLGLKHDGPGNVFRNMEHLQETVLRGQFSLFPVAIRTPFWTSPRSRGLKAVQDLGPAIKSQLRSHWETFVPREHGTCPFTQHIIPANDGNDEALNEEDIISHVRLFTSSIANKALASLLTAFFMNLFLWRDGAQHEPSLADLIRQQQDRPTKRAILSSALRETMRLSPPVIGVMRRVTQAVRLTHPGSGQNPTTSHIIPAGHDAWLYFVAANRDPDVFARPTEFCWDRFMRQGTEISTDEDCGIALGLGPKRCLGADLTRQICLTVAETVIESGLAMKIEGQVGEGVNAWLGWKADADPEAMARDLKQLPCQRPREPIMVMVKYAN